MILFIKKAKNVVPCQYNQYLNVGDLLSFESVIFHMKKICIFLRISNLFFFLRSGLTVESIFQNWLDTSGIPKVSIKYQVTALSSVLIFSLYYVFKSLLNL